MTRQVIERDRLAVLTMLDQDAPRILQGDPVNVAVTSTIDTRGQPARSRQSRRWTSSPRRKS